MSLIDITMTGVLRPKILNSTLRTIYNNVCNKDTKDFRLIYNLDPVGEQVKTKTMIEIAKEWFPNIIYNIAEEPSFPKAVKWVWSQVEAPYVFHWEDDVDILRPIDINRMIKIHIKNPTLSSLRLNKFDIPNKNKFFVFQCSWVYKEGFYLASDWKKQFGLNPILIKNQFVKEAVALMVDDINPEKQFRDGQKFMKDHIKKWEYGIYASPGDKRLIDGRKGQRWKDDIGLQKPNNQTFLKWEKVQ